MKRLRHLFLLLTFLSSVPLWAQSGTSTLRATIKSDFLIQLSQDRLESIPLGDPIWMDISHLGFADEVQADQFFGAYMDNRIGFELDFDRRKVGLILNEDPYTPQWGLKEWNQYLLKKSVYAPQLGN